MLTAVFIAHTPALTPTGVHTGLDFLISERPPPPRDTVGTGTGL
jgi:hypothetical protein